MPDSLSPNSRVVRFGAYEADLRAAELRKGGMKLRLHGQPFQVLALLLEKTGQVVTRDEIRQSLWPADTFVDFDNGLNTAINKIREALCDSADKPRFIETLPRRGYRFLVPIENAPPQIRSLAVLPIQNLSGDPEQEYFAEGMTETLITTLAKIGALRVTSRTSALRYRKTDKALRLVAEELGVDAVVEGTVLRSGNRVRISAQLIDGRTDMHLWAETYDREMRDVLALHSEVAKTIAREVQVKLTPFEQLHLAAAGPVDPQAYESYLKGRYYWNRRSGEGLQKAMQSFQQAIAVDPAYAAAQTGLADCLGLLGFWGFVPPNEGCGVAKRLALRALEMDPNLAEAHTSLAWSTMLYDFDFLAAEKEYERSIELNPRYATGRHWFGLHQAMSGRYEEGYAELKRAARLDPYSSMIHATLGYVQFCARKFDQGCELLEKAVQLDPNLFQIRVGLGYAYGYRGEHDRGIAEIQKGLGLSLGGSEFITWLGEAHVRAGHRDQAEKVLEDAVELSKQRYVSSYYIARLCAALGRSEDTLQWLNTAYQERAAWLAFVNIDPVLDIVRSDPRFQDLLRRMNFPEG